MREPDGQATGAVLAFDFGEKRIGVAVGEPQVLLDRGVEQVPLLVHGGQGGAHRALAQLAHLLVSQLVAAGAVVQQAQQDHRQGLDE